MPGRPGAAQVEGGPGIRAAREVLRWHQRGCRWQGAGAGRTVKAESLLALVTATWSHLGDIAHSRGSRFGLGSGEWESRGVHAEFEVRAGHPGGDVQQAFEGDKDLAFEQ